MSGRRARARLELLFCLGPLLCLAVLSFFASGCERDAGLSLLTVAEVAPRDVELGERIEISGQSFPRGRTARVMFQGALHRAGAEPRRGFEASAEGVVVSDRAIEVAYDERLQSLFCGPEGRAGHTTFRGEVVVAFAAAIPGAPPASATLPNVVLDLRPPPADPATATRLRTEGERFLESSGLAIETTDSARGGLVLGAVRDGSAAARAGLLAGDVIVSTSGVVVRSVAETVPPPSARSVTITARRGGDPTEVTFELPLDGYRPHPALLPLALTIAFAAAIVIWLFAPLPRFARYVARRLARASSLGDDGTRWFELSPFLVIPLVVAVPLVLRSVASFEPELVSIALATVGASLALVGVTTDGTFFRSLQRAFGTALALVPAALAVAATSVLTGAARVSEASHLQGGMPWEFAAVRGLSTFVVFAAAVLSLSLPTEATAPFGRAGRVARAGTNASVIAMSSLLVIVLGGGWQAPHTGGAIALSMGAALYCAKSALLALGVLELRRALPALSARWRMTATVVLSGLVIGAASLATWEARLTTPSDARLIAFGLSALVIVGLVRVGIIALRERDARVTLDPFA